VLGSGEVVTVHSLLFQSSYIPEEVACGATSKTGVGDTLTVALGDTPAVVLGVAFGVALTVAPFSVV